jgi:Protein of unknown function (DUF3500)
VPKSSALRARIRLGFALACVLLTSSPFGQERYDDSLLGIKRLFAANEIAALSQPYVGIATSKGITPGLFPIKSTGVSTEPVRLAAEKFLGTLTRPQLLKTLFAFDDPEWRRWSNVDNGIYVRQGVSLEEMTPPQREAAFGLMRGSLSAKGMQLSLDIMKTDQTLREINNDELRYGEQKYFFTVMGRPSAEEPWGWQLDGHHLIVNFFVLGDQVVMTPLFLGGEPVVTEHGKYAGNAVLQDEQNQGLALLQSLTDEQRKKAVLGYEKTVDFLQAQAGRDNLVLDYAGIPAASLTPDQKLKLLELINLYVGNSREEQARIRLDQVHLHLDETYFAWIGRSDADAVFYYRIHSPVILIEFDHQNPIGMQGLLPADRPTRQHIHTIVRTPNGNDYGKDLLRQHLERHAH